MDASSRIPKVHNPLEFEDGLAYLMKTDILREIMYFSYDPQSLANLYPLYAEDVWDIIRMNRNGEKPASLKDDSTPSSPEFVTAVGDDAINRFDEARKRKKKKKSGAKKSAGAPKSENVQTNGDQKSESPKHEAPKHENRPQGEKPQNKRRNNNHRKDNRPRKEEKNG
jgi:hypothetical protein